MKVCKSLYSAFLPLGCKDSSQQFQHPQLQGGTLPGGFSTSKKEAASPGDKRSQMTSGPWASGEPALHCKARWCRPQASHSSEAGCVCVSPPGVQWRAREEAADKRPAFATGVSIPGTHGRGVHACRQRLPMGSC